MACCHCAGWVEFGLHRLLWLFSYGTGRVHHGFAGVRNVRTARYVLQVMGPHRTGWVVLVLGSQVCLWLLVAKGECTSVFSVVLLGFDVIFPNLLFLVQFFNVEVYFCWTLP